MTAENSTKPNAAKLQAAWTSILITILLIAAKLIIGLSTDSLALIGQATDSGFDLIALLVTLFAVRISTVPPDEDHPYGHGKFENLSALAQSLLLLGITIFIGIEATGRISGRLVNDVEVTPWSFAVLIVSIALDMWRSRMLHKAGKEHNSQALEASALNFFTDILSAVLALVGLALVRFAHWQTGDAWAALALCGFVGFLSVRMGKSAIDGLTDRFARSEEYRALLTSVEGVSGVESVRRLRVRPAGPTYFIDVTLHLSRVLPIGAIQKILSDVDECIRTTFPDADVTVHYHPIRTIHESPFETLKLIASDHGVFPHNVELTRTTQGDLLLDFHLEFPPRFDLRGAHTISEEIEKEVRKQLPEVDRISVHLEEERSDKTITTVSDITSAREDLVLDIGQCSMESSSQVHGVTDLTISENLTSREIKLVLTLELDPELSLSEAHDVATIVELALRRRFTEIQRIVIHAEPSARSSSDEN